MSPASKKARKQAASAARARRDEARFLMNTYRRPPVMFTHGKGCYLYDERGRAYLDFLGGIAVNALGHAHPRLVRVIRREAARTVHVSNLFHNPYQGPLARKLAEWSGLDRVFFTNSGSEAIDGAMKLARAYARKHSGEATKKTRVLALENSFHGRTFGALSITATEKYRKPFEPLVPGVEFVRCNDVADLEAKFDDTVCALFVETIQGEGGIFPMGENFWCRARELATKHNAAVVADEIQCGLGRTGRAFAYQKFNAPPDIVTVAKPLAGGLPLGAILANEKFATAFSPGLHGTTFGGGPLVCATALEFLTVVEEQKLMENVRERGAELRDGLEKLAARFEFVREIRGEGLMWGVDLAVDGGDYVKSALARGLIINCTHDHILRLLPPFIVRAAHVKEFLGRFETVLARTPKPKAKPAAEAPAAEAKSQAMLATAR
jgi:acetylornithine/N-succinyldiaminopimelate aminotransferase